MNHDEQVEAVRSGRRALSPLSIHAEAKPGGCPGWNHSWRTISCNDETDVVECSRCGKQEVTKCNFDEEYA